MIISNKARKREEKRKKHSDIIMNKPTPMKFPQDPICQSCGMPLRNKEDYGTNADKGKNEDYCFHCFQKGKFLDEGITLQEKIEKNIKFGVQMGMPEKMARHMSESILPNLKRWKKKP